MAVVERPGRGYGVVAACRIAAGAIVFQEASLAVVTIDDDDVDPTAMAINDDARTVLALAQMARGGSPPTPDEWATLPGMRRIAERITMLQAHRAFGPLSPSGQRRWMQLCDSSEDSLSHVDGSKMAGTAAKSPAGVLHSNGFGGTANGRRTCVLFEKISRCNHSCAPNVDMQTTAATDTAETARTARLLALRDIEEGEELYLSYLGSVGSSRMAAPTDERRAELRRKYRFHCECERCGLLSAAARRQCERLEAHAEREDARVSAQVMAYNAGELR